MSNNNSVVSSEYTVPDTFLEFHRLLNDEVDTVQASDGEITLKKHGNNNHWIGAFPESYVTGEKGEHAEDYPIAVIRTPNISDVRRGYRFGEEFLTVTLEVYGVRAEHPARFISKAKHVIMENRDRLNSAGLYQISFEQSNNDMVMRGENKVHEMSIPITMRRVSCQ